MQDENINTENNKTQGAATGGVADLATMQATKAAEQAENTMPLTAANATSSGNKSEDAKSKPVVKAAPAKPAPSKLTVAKPQAIGLPSDDYVKRIANKIRDAENILVALSRDPSVDELAAALGLALFLDGMQKHTTAIYSGQAPDALKFLQPEGTFETNTDSLQDFIIALSKDKADHLRYKLDGDFVKVYITPYKTTISEADLEFSYGDYNVDLVLALGVPTADDLDEALSEHGRIMHDATTVDITCDAPGKFAEIEWSDTGMSSVSEMVTRLIFDLQDDAEEGLDKEIATALLTGIVASTERFSNGRTTSDTMQLASKLMSMGADQQLIAAHVMDNNPATSASGVAPESGLSMGYDAGMTMPDPLDTVTTVEPSAPVMATESNDAAAAMEPEVSATPDMSSVSDDSQAVADTQGAGPVVEPGADESGPSLSETNALINDAVSDAVNNAVANAAAVGATGAGIEPVATLPTVQPAEPGVSQAPVEGPKDYAAMLEQALSEPSLTAAENAGIVPNLASAMPAGTPVVSAGGVEMGTNVGTGSVEMAASGAMDNAGFGNAMMNPAASAAPAEPVLGEPVARQAVVLPPPPTPEVGADMMPPVLPQVQIPPELVN